MKAAEWNKAVARRAIEEIWNQHDLDAVQMLYAQNHASGDRGASVSPGREGIALLVGQILASAPGARLSIDLILAEGDKVAMRYTASNGPGHKAPGAPQPALTGALVVRMVRGQIRESWGTARMVERLRSAGGAPKQ